MAYLPLFFILVAFLLSMFISLSHSSLDYGNFKTSSPAKHNEKVTLSLYYEALCPYSASFITDDLAAKVFQTDLNTIVNLRLVPWGNAILVNKKIKCQHGEEECYLNTIHGCVVHLWPDVKKHFDFINCTEERSSKRGLVKTIEETWEEIWEPCSEILTLSKDRIKECYNSGYGHKLQLRYANETASLRPPHAFVPWVTVNNQPLRDDFKNFVKYVCKAYKGDHVPEACKSQWADVCSAENEMVDKIQLGVHAHATESESSESPSSAPKTSPSPAPAPGREFSMSDSESSSIPITK